MEVGPTTHTGGLAVRRGSPEAGLLRIDVNVPPERRLHDSYNLLEHRLGLGAFSVVRLAFKREGNEQVAVKIVRRHGGDKDNRIDNEIMVMQECVRLQCANLLRLIDVFDEGREVMIVTELLPGGSLLERLQKEGTLGEVEARDVTTQLAAGLKALHVRHDAEGLGRSAIEGGRKNGSLEWR
jgi:serine/threonine protein kinase